MLSFPQEIYTAIDRYEGLVRAGEKRALRVAEHEPRQAAIASHLHRGVARWLGALWAHRVHPLLHGSAAQGEQVTG
jgi:hypothetical protein